MIMTKENILTTVNTTVSNESEIYPFVNILNSWINIYYKGLYTSENIEIATNAKATYLCMSGVKNVTSLILEHYSDDAFLTKIGEDVIVVETLIVQKLSITESYRKLLIVNSGVETPEIGYIELSDNIEGTCIVNSGKPIITLVDDVDETSLGNNNVLERYDRDDISLTFWIAEDIFEEFVEIFKNHRQKYPLFIWQFPDGSTYKNKRCLIFDTNEIAPSRTIFGKGVIYYRFTVAFKEAK